MILSVPGKMVISVAHFSASPPAASIAVRNPVAQMDIPGGRVDPDSLPSPVHRKDWIPKSTSV